MVPFMQSGVPIVGRWAEHSGELQGCPDCGYLAFSPLPSDQVLGEYYGSQYWELGGSAQEAKADYEQGGGYKTAAGELVQIWREAGIGNEAARLHEIGCGYGVAVHYLREAGVAATGSDLSSSAVRIARDNGNPHTEALPLKAYLAARPDDRINFFYMSHSLEHMPEPAGLVQDVHDHLPAGGLFVIRVPNGKYLLSRLQSFYEYTWLQYPDHLHYFTPKSAVCLLERGGFEICSVSTLVRETLPQLMISASLGRQWAQLPDPGAWLRGICANWLGMELQIIARKSPQGVVGPSAGVRQALDRFEADTRRMEAPPRVAGANIAAFDPRGMAGEWRYAAVQDGAVRPLQPAGDGKRLISDHGIQVLRALHFVPKGATLRLTHLLGDLPQGHAAIRQFDVGVILLEPEAEYEVRIFHRDALYLHKRLRGAYRYSETVRLHAPPGEEVHLEVTTLEAAWPSIYLHASSEWLCATAPLREPVAEAAP